MNPRVPLPRPARLTWRSPLLALLLAHLAGCSQPQFRSQKEEETDKERYAVKTVGDISSFGNADPVPVSGVGLVEGLAGTGCPTPPGEMRQLIENELRKQKVENIREILASNEYAVVLIQAMLPAGVKKGEHVDLEVALPPGSRATSLRGGQLRRCVLHNFDYAGNFSTRYAGTNATLRGHPIVRAEGALVVGSSGGEESEKMKRGRIWGGGTCLIDRQFHVVLNSNNQFARVSANVANRVNQAFQGSVTMAPGSELAIAKTGSIVLLNVPPQYKLNLPRFLRVVRMVPIEETAPPENGPPRLPYREQLREDLLDPARAVVASLRLEAMGTDSIPALKRGLESPHPLVRFCSAEALAYLGSPSAGEELAKVVKQQPYLRAFALTAMASLDEAVCHVKLRELMESELDDETRYGAFRALRVLDERDPAVRGEEVNGAFWVHEVARAGKPLVHFSTNRRAEIVLFGKGAKLVPPFTIVSGEFALTASEGDERCTISHVALHSEEGDTSRMRCSLELAEVMRTLAKLGATYPEVIEVLRQADGCKNLSCRVRNDALPQAITVEQLAHAGREKVQPKPGEERTDEVQLIKNTLDLGTTPTLYQLETARRRSPREKQVAERK